MVPSLRWLARRDGSHDAMRAIIAAATSGSSARPANRVEKMDTCGSGIGSGAQGRDHGHAVGSGPDHFARIPRRDTADPDQRHANFTTHGANQRGTDELEVG